MNKIVVATDDFILDIIEATGYNVSAVATLGYGQTRLSQGMHPSYIDWIDYKILDDANLIIFTGGEDINPKIYGQENTHSGVNPARDSAEVEVLKYALSLHKKVLGICRGHQLINAYLGGSLVQDLEALLNVRHPAWHKLVPINDGGIVSEIFNEVNSIHHQGVRTVGQGLTATTLYRGVIESCESQDIITTQFHPEFMQTKESKLFFNYIKKWASIGE